MNNANLKKNGNSSSFFHLVNCQVVRFTTNCKLKKGSENSYSCKMCTSNNKATVTTNTATYTTTF